MIEHCPDPDARWQEIARVAYDVAHATLNEQHAAVRDLRARTGALLTATSVVVSFLGARALTTSHLRGLAFLGLGVFVLSLVLSLYVLLPTEEIKSLTAGSVLLGSSRSSSGDYSSRYHDFDAQENAQKACPAESKLSRAGIQATEHPAARLRRDHRDDQTRARRDPRQALETSGCSTACSQGLSPWRKRSASRAHTDHARESTRACPSRSA
jgi:hypothetical protein